MPKLTVIIPITGFAPLRENGLNKCLQALKKQTFKDFEVVIVEQAGQANEFHNFDKSMFPHFQHITLVNQPRGFNKAWCMNVGVRKSSTELLCFMDSDMNFDEFYLEKAYQFKLEQKHRFFVGWTQLIKEAGKDEPTERMVDGRTIKTAGGIFWIDKYFWWEVGGMQENFFGYGGEDNDFWQRANLCLGGDWKHCWVHYFEYTIRHTYHHDAVPSAERLELLNRTADQPQEVIRRLKKYFLGDVLGPVEVNTLNIKLKKNPVYKDSGKHEFLNKEKK